MKIQYLTTLGASCLLAASSSAAVVGITATTTDIPLTSSGTLDALITAVEISGTTHSDLAFLAATGVNNNTDPFNGTGEATHPASNTADTLAMLSSGFVTQGKANAGFVNYAIGSTVDAADGDVFFMYEFNVPGQVGDDVTITPLDTNGDEIGAWSLTLNPSDYGPQTDTFRVSLGVGLVGAARGVSFTLADFTGDVGLLTGVAGLRFTDVAAGWDPITVGQVIIPEPASMALLSLGGLLMFSSRRH